MAGHKKIVNPKTRKRLRRKVHIRKRVQGTAERPRLSVFRSQRHIYAQVIDDRQGHTLAAASSLDGAFEGPKSTDSDAARQVGALVARRAVEKGITNVVFDRGGYLYHGRVRALADGAREGGLQF